MIYIHLPFCHHRCVYCNFFATAAKTGREGFERWILTEIHQRHGFLEGMTIPSIYFGGGTPSLMNPVQLERILKGIQESFTLSEDAEITLEANPEDMSVEKCLEWKRLGINRLSIGVQSFRDEDLKWLGRIHSARKSREGIESALSSGFSEVSIDLIYGIPGQGPDDWQNNLKIFSAYRLPHLSTYWLTVEPSTPLEKLLMKGRKDKLDEDSGEQHFLFLMQWAREQGYEHYEISNLCLPGHYSRHNTAYWKGHPYLGLGPSAHSYKQSYRCWNPSSLNAYYSCLEHGILPEGEEFLSAVDQFNEFVMLRVRTQWGLSFNELKMRFGEPAFLHCLNSSKQWVEKGFAYLHDGVFTLNDSGKLLADGIASSFFL